MADSSKKAVSPLKISQVVSGRSSLPVGSKQRHARTLPTRKLIKRVPFNGQIVAKATKALNAEVAKMHRSSREQHQQQYINYLEKENSEMKTMLTDCRGEIMKMQLSLQFLLNNVNKMLKKDQVVFRDSSFPATTLKTKATAKQRAGSPHRNGDASTPSRKHQLPITSIEMFRVFEKNLMSKEFFNNVINSLKSQKIAAFIEASLPQGPQDMENVMTFITKILLAPQVLGQFKWTRKSHDPPDEPVFRNYDFFRSLFMFLVNKTCLPVLRQTIDPKAYENFFRLRIQREAIVLQKIIKSQLQELGQPSPMEQGDEMEVEAEPCMWQSQNGISNSLVHPVFGESFEADAEIKQEPIDFVDVMQSNTIMDPSNIKSEPTEVDDVVLNTWTAGSGNES